jgi:hypothetical protein
VFWNISSRLIKKSHFLVVTSLQVALLGPTSAANSKSDECGLASVYSTTGEETASGEDTQSQDFTGDIGHYRSGRWSTSVIKRMGARWSYGLPIVVLLLAEE